MSCPIGLLRISLISRVTFSPGRWPPIPGLVPWPILISMASAFLRFSGVTLYRLPTYSKMYLSAACISSGRMPPSPEHMAVWAMAEPLASATFASRERAPKDMWEMYTGFSRISGRLARGPMTVVVRTGASSSSGIGSSWAPKIRMSSQFGIGSSVPIAADWLLPVTAISWISFIYRQAGSSRTNSFGYSSLRVLGRTGSVPWSSL